MDSSVQLTLAGAATVAATYGLARYSYGLFLPDIRADFALDTRILGLMASGSFALYLLATVVAPYLSARVGPRLPVVLGGSCAILGMATIAFSRDAWTLAAGVILAGASPGLAFTPMPDAIARSITGEDRRGRALAVVNSGTSFGVVVAGPVALWAGAQWRSAWLFFAVIALACTLWVARVLPKKGPTHGKNVRGIEVGQETSNRPRRLTPASRRLFFSAFAAALTTSAYWTFAVDLAVSVGSAPRYLGSVFFMVVGISGISGALAGELVARFGLRWILRATVIALSSSICLLPLASSYWSYTPAILASALLFGAAFFVMTSVLVVYSTRIFQERPSVGLGAVLFLVGIGQVLGPTLSGFLAEWVGLSATFYLSGLLALSISAYGPEEKASIATEHGTQHGKERELVERGTGAVRIETLAGPVETSDELARDVRAGLLGSPKDMSPWHKYHYDSRGSKLFEEITASPEYYQTNAEISILREKAEEIVSRTRCREIVELGSGSATKTRVLLEAVLAASESHGSVTEGNGGRSRVRYVPLDVSRTALEESARSLVAEYPGLEVVGFVGDYNLSLEPLLSRPANADAGGADGGRLVIFLGGTIGNLTPERRGELLKGVRAGLRSGEHVLIGVDLVKDAEVLEAAYNDPSGVASGLNKNLLEVLNERLGAEFEPDLFVHRGSYDPQRGRIEMWLYSEVEQEIPIKGLGTTVRFEKGEGVRTAISAKFTPESASRMLEEAGLAPLDLYTDEGGLFALVLGRAR